MPSKYSESAEVQIIRFIAHTKDVTKLAMLVPDWFSELHKNLVIAWKSNNSLLSRTNLETYATEHNISFGNFFPETSTIFTPPRDEEFDDTVKILEVKYSQRKLEALMKEIDSTLYENDPMEAAIKINDLITKMSSNSKTIVRKIGTDLQDENPALINFGPRRPGVNRTLPARKNVLVIGGDSGHHKSNNVIDMLDAVTEYNVIQLQNSNFNVDFFSKEMDYEEVEDRIISKKMAWPLEDVTKRNGKWDKAMVEDYLQDPMKLKYIRDNIRIISPDQFHNESDIIRFLVQSKADVWALDFLQYYAQMSANNDPTQQNVNVMRAIAYSKAIVQMTKSLAIVVSMIKKKAESRLTHFPRLDDLEWSGLTKQLAHAVGMCFWPYKVDQRKEKYIYFVSWQKVRKNDLFNEMLVVKPEIAEFKPMGLKDAQSWQYLAEM